MNNEANNLAVSIQWSKIIVNLWNSDKKVISKECCLSKLET